jgi:hypothetical protein
MEVRGTQKATITMRSSAIYCIKELFGRNYPHLASVNSAYKIYEIVVR